MKRILLPLALLLAACSTTEYIQVDQSTPVLVMNAQMRVQEDIHYIHLSRSLLSTLSAEPGATVSVSVNGAAPVMASEVGSGGGNSCMYEFNTAIKSGDVVAVHAVSSDNIEVSSSFSVPQNVLLGGISITENVVHSSLYDDLFSLSGEVDDSPRWAQINVVLNDVPAVENYYRIELWTDEIHSGTRVSYPFSLIDTTSDPVLTPVSSGSLIEMLTSEANNYNVFSDMAFADGSYTMRLFVLQSDIDSRRVEGAQKNLCVRLTSLTQMHYLYVKGLGLGSMLFSESVSMPDNVEGGMGFLAAGADNTLTLAL